MFNLKQEIVRVLFDEMDSPRIVSILSQNPDEIDNVIYRNLLHVTSDVEDAVLELADFNIKADGYSAIRGKIDELEKEIIESDLFLNHLKYYLVMNGLVEDEEDALVEDIINLIKEKV